MRARGARARAGAGGGRGGAGGAGRGGAWAALGVERGAPAAEVRRAYRRRARKLHPDVNRAPDAAEQFVALQQAYAQCLREAAGAAGGGSGATAGAGTGGAGQWPPGSPPRAGGGPAKPGAARRPAEPEEPFYGFGEFFRDLEADAARAAAAGASAAAPRSSMEELGSIAGGLADELLEFLEEQAGLRPSSEGRADDTGRSGGGRGARADTNTPRAREPPRRPAPPPPPPPPPRAAPAGARRPRSFESLEVDEELQKLKREMGLE